MKLPFFRVIQSEYLVLLLSGAYFLILAPFTPELASVNNLSAVLSTLLPLFVAAMGQTLVMIAGGIDLSLTAIIALASVTGAALMNTETGWLAGHWLAVPAGIAGMLIVGALIGGVNGLAVACLRMPPFIVTLTTMMFFSGLAICLTQSKNINSLPPVFNALGGKVWLALLISASLALMAHVMLKGSLWGRWIYASGHNAKASLISGVPVAGVLISAYMVSGLFAAFASILYTGQAETGSPVLGQRILLDVIGATVIGGASLFGGKGKIIWAFYGVLFIKLIDNSLGLLNFSYFSIMLAKGGVILLAALLDSIRHRSVAVT